MLHILLRLQFYGPVTGYEVLHRFNDDSGHLVGDSVVLTSLSVVDNSPLLDVNAQRNICLEHVVSLNKKLFG